MRDSGADSRNYAGMSSEERQARRHAQLLEAGLELFGTQGYAGSSIRDVCTHAGLNRRYFYESFRTREDLLRAVYDDIVAEMVEKVFTAVASVDGLDAKVQAGMTAFWTMMTSDLRKVRILTIEVIGVSEDLERRRREARHNFADFFALQARELAAARGSELVVDVALAARALVAATMDLLVDWMRGDIDDSVEQLVEHCVQLFSMVASSAFSEPDHGAGHRAVPRAT